MSKINKVKLNDYFIIDNVNLKDAFEIKKILTYLKNFNLLKYSNLINVDLSSINTVVLFIKKIIENNDYLLCMRCTINNKILYIMHCRILKNNTVEVDIVSNGKREFKKIIDKKYITDLYVFYVEVFNIFLRLKNYKKITYSVAKNNNMMKNHIDNFPEFLRKLGYIVEEKTTNEYNIVELYDNDKK
jgi:hypothetical protein